MVFTPAKYAAESKTVAQGDLEFKLTIKVAEAFSEIVGFSAVEPTAEATPAVKQTTKAATPATTEAAEPVAAVQTVEEVAPAAPAAEAAPAVEAAPAQAGI